MPTTKIKPSFIASGSFTGSFLGTASYTTTASYALVAGSGGSGGGGSTQTGSIANQTILYNVTTSQDNIISGLNLSSNKWGVTVVEEWNSVSVPGDLYYNSSSLLLHFDGTNDSTTFTDNSPNNFTVTSTNGAKITSSISKFGGSSGFFDGTNDYLSLSSDTKFAISTTEDYTVECWVNFRTVQDCAFWQTTNNPSSADGPFWFGYAAGKLYSSRHGSGLYAISYVWSPSTNTWYHVAATRASGTVRLFVNGVVVTTDASTQNGISFTQSGGAVGLLTTPAYFNGYIDELRVTKGVARYTGSFSTQSIDFPNSTGSIQYATKYIGLVGGLNDSTVDYGVEKLSDSSLKIRKMSVSGQPLSGSGALSASVDRVYVNVLDYTNVMVTSSYALTASYVAGGFQTGSITNQSILYNVTTSQDNTITGLNLSSNKWGISVIEEWNSGSILGDDYYSSCSLLLPLTGSNNSTTIVDRSVSPNTMTANGDAKISTVQSKFGNGSLYLDGNGDYLTAPNVSSLLLGTSDFTIECFLYLTQNGTTSAGETYAPLVSLGNWFAVNSNSRVFYSFTYNVQAGNKLTFSTKAGDSFSAPDYYSANSNAINIPLNTWVHVAITRTSNQLKFWYNGSLVGTDTSYSWNTINLNVTSGSNNNLYIGRISGGSVLDSALWHFPGYLSNVRITKDVARYTGSFTTSSVEFPISATVAQYATKYIGLVGGLNDNTVDYGVEKLSDSSLKIRKMSATGQPLSGSGALSASVDRVYVNVLDYTNVQTTVATSSYAVTSSFAQTTPSGKSIALSFILG